MSAKEKIKELLEASEEGVITTAQVVEAGLHRGILQEFVKMARYTVGAWHICAEQCKGG